MTNVLITGCTGFIGSNLTKNLVENECNVYGLIRHSSTRDLRRLGSTLEKMCLIEGDLSQYHSVCSALALANPQFVLHLGALTPVRYSFEDPFPFISVNFQGTVNLVHCILEKAPKARLVYASTAEVYGWQKKEPIKETAMLRPASPYAVSKAATDQYVQMAAKVYGLRATILRPINTYGRKGEKGFFVEYLVTSMLKGETVYVGAPNSIRDYMFVDDHINAYLATMKHNEAEGQIFNVSPGNPIPNKEVAKILAKLIGFKGEIKLSGYPPGYPQRSGQQDPEYLALDNTKIRTQLGWKPTITLEEGLARAVETWKKSE